MEIRYYPKKPLDTTLSPTIGIILLSCSLISFTLAKMEVSETQQIALESSGELLPSETLVARITKDLAAIRSKFPVVKDVTHTAKWQPGKVMIQDVKKESLDALNASRFGPSQAKAIFQNSIFLVTFTKPYNPEKLKEVLQQELGISNVRPDGILGGSSSITLTSDAATAKNTYVFFKGSGDAPSGCINKHFWTFTVGPGDNSVQLVEERGDNPGGSSPEDRPVGMGMGMGMFGIH